MEESPTGPKRGGRLKRVSAEAEVSSEEFWSRRWSFARYTLGLSESEFWDSTPRSLDYLADRLIEARKREDWQVALVVSTIVNVSMARPKDGVKPEDYLPRYEDEEPVEKVDNEMKKKLASINLTSIITGLFQRQQKNAGVTNGS